MSRGERVGHILSEALGPAPLLTIAFVEARLQVGSAAGWWALLPILGVAVLPYLAMIWLAHRGRVSDRFVGKRSQRLPILLGALVVVAVIVILLAAEAPWEATSLTIASAVGLVVVMAVNVVWKMSIHMAIAAFLWAYQLTVLPGWLVVLLVLAVVALGWARIAARAHTLAQVIAGCGAGLAVFGVYMLL
ncbi:hypothetical protein ATY41_05970 [Leifsonia xyli subsp. xyli]|uniref:Phosphoesterase PA-phosphatase n=2 Tax=Leifsonia xyli TaxID=1575 RepID=A0A1E2SI69_LEIXY|nr:hypothetical protein ATY41_05970 [Leifsonia xyli subsp. xyli]